MIIFNEVNKLYFLNKIRFNKPHTCLLIKGHRYDNLKQYLLHIINFLYKNFHYKFYMLIFHHFLLIINKFDNFQFLVNILKSLKLEQIFLYIFYTHLFKNYFLDTNQFLKIQFF